MEEFTLLVLYKIDHSSTDNLETVQTPYQKYHNGSEKSTTFRRWSIVHRSEFEKWQDIVAQIHFDERFKCTPTWQTLTLTN